MSSLSQSQSPVLFNQHCPLKSQQNSQIFLKHHYYVIVHSESSLVFTQSIPSIRNSPKLSIIFKNPRIPLDPIQVPPTHLSMSSITNSPKLSEPSLVSTQSTPYTRNSQKLTIIFKISENPIRHHAGPTNPLINVVRYKLTIVLKKAKNLVTHLNLSTSYQNSFWVPLRALQICIH